MLRKAISCLSLGALLSCNTMSAPPLDENTLTTANGVRFRTLSGINDTCDTPYSSDPIGWGGKHVSVEQGGKVRQNPKFNFASPNQDFRNQAVGDASTLTFLLANEYQWGCSQWQLAPEAEKAIYLGYFREAIMLTFEAATRFEAAGRIGPNALRPEVQSMRDKFEELVAHKPEYKVQRSRSF